MLTIYWKKLYLSGKAALRSLILKTTQAGKTRLLCVSFATLVFMTPTLSAIKDFKLKVPPVTPKLTSSQGQESSSSKPASSS